jgi:hypothetical protein
MTPRILILGVILQFERIKSEPKRLIYLFVLDFLYNTTEDNIILQMN